MAARQVDPDIGQAIGTLLARTGRAASPHSIEPLASGGNNRVFLVRSGAESYVAKWYFHGSGDGRDRLRSEYAFLEQAWSAGLRCVPQPLASDPARHVALYEHVLGRRLAAGEVDEARVLEAARFFAALNEPSRRRAAAALPAASEACFSVAEHLAMVDERLARFENLRVESDADRDALAYLGELGKAWREQKARILAADARPEQALEARWRCVSPSDFGFHNALARADGSLCFLDFEYAGWDDPAKAFGDFFAHPGSPVARRHRDAFLQAAAAPFEDAGRLLARAQLLEPVFRVKWCCIILNEFLPAAAERRRFANPQADAEAGKRAQLQKAQRLSIHPTA
jgi:hypothetical protein